jgi:CRISPR-associated protein Cmr1
MNLRTTTIYLIKPKNNFWSDWQSAMDDLRENFYRKLKEVLEVKSIGSIKPRKPSPLVIQIKKIKNNKFLGILLVYQNWEYYQDILDFIDRTDFEFEIRKLNFIKEARHV